jgi:hypothetical protein
VREGALRAILDCVAPRFWRAYVDGYTAPAKIDSRLATKALKAPSGELMLFEL